MKFSIEVCQLSQSFYEAYPASQYPEIMRKGSRPYTCFVAKIFDDTWICIPFRSSIHHNEAYLFTGTQRSKRTHSGLDYKKLVLIKDASLIDFAPVGSVDDDEYAEAMINAEIIVHDVQEYIQMYIHHVDGTAPLHEKKYNRHYQFSTLPYFHKELGLWHEWTEEQYV